MIFSKQVFYCRACGTKMMVDVNAPYQYQVCGKECWEELEWRKALSILGKDYYPKDSNQN